MEVCYDGNLALVMPKNYVPVSQDEMEYIDGGGWVRWTVVGVGAVAGTIIGVFGGVAAGAALGTITVPIVGTLSLAVVGGIAGGITGFAAGANGGDALCDTLGISDL